jgi:hypothetical protein
VKLPIFLDLLVANYLIYLLNMVIFHSYVILPELVGGFNPSEKYESQLG